MNAVDGFVDTNVFLYSVDPRDPQKQRLARELISSLAESGTGFVSGQVLLEFASNLVRKFGMSPGDAGKLLRGLNEFHVVPMEPPTVLRALELMDLASLSFWDAAIVAAAEAGRCGTLYTEDLSHGQLIAGIKIVNPF